MHDKRQFVAILVCINGKQIPNCQLTLFLKEQRGGLRLPVGEDPESVKAIMKEVRFGERWSVSNPTISGEYLEFDTFPAHFQDDVDALLEENQITDAKVSIRKIKDQWIPWYTGSPEHISMARRINFVMPH